MNEHEMGLPREQVILSPAGAARSEAIRGVVLAAATSRRRRRTVVRGGAALAAVAIAGAATLWTVRAASSSHTGASPDSASTFQPRGPMVPPDAPAAADKRNALAASGTEPTVVRREIRPEPGIVQRLAVTSEPMLVREIGDSELIALVGATGNRYGLERIGDRVRMVCLDCGDRTSGGPGTN